MEAPQSQDVTNLALVLLGAFWSGTSSVYLGIKNASEIRDRVLKGKIGDDAISSEQRRRLFWWDWMPLKLSLALVSAVLCTVILALPGFKGGYESSFARVCYAAAAVPFLGAVFQLVACIADGRYMLRAMKFGSTEPHR